MSQEIVVDGKMLPVPTPPSPPKKHGNHDSSAEVCVTTEAEG